MSDEIVREYHVSTFRGKVEDVPIADGVDMEEIRRSDPNAMFVTLPIAEIGAISNNGLLYDESLVNSIVAQINADRPGGILGHVPDEERSTSFPLPAGLWVGAMLAGETLWAKSYVPPGAAREYMGNLKKVGGQIATSIYGKGKFERVRDGVRRLTNFKLESLDFAPPGRAALGMGAIPHVTAEMDSEQEPIMADKAQVIAELRNAKVTPQRGWQPSGETVDVSEMQGLLAERDDRITVLETTVGEFRRREFERAVDAVVVEMTDWPVRETAPDSNGKTAKDKLAALRAMFKRAVVDKMGDEQDSAKVAEMAAAAWEEIKPIAEMMRDALAGPAAIVGGRVSEGGRKPLEDTPENRDKAMSQMGITV